MSDSLALMLTWAVLIGGGLIALVLIPAVIAAVLELIPYVFALAICWWIFQWLT